MPRGRPKGVLSPERAVNCVRCGAAFMTRHSQGKYCPEGCRRDALRDGWRMYNGGTRRRLPDDRRIANNAVHAAILGGRMTKQPCEVCGDRDAQAHHDDYRRPLDVRWLCPPHHRAADAERRAREATQDAATTGIHIVDGSVAAVDGVAVGEETLAEVGD